MSFRSKDLLRELIGIPSVNPAFQAVETGPEAKFCGEANLTNFLQEFLEERGWPWLRQTVHPGRDNLVALFSDTSGQPQNFPLEPITLWEVHQDTVGVTGMKIDPFSADESQGRIYGRGACDVKGAMAAILSAFASFSEAGQRPRGTHLLAFTVNEESGFTGARSLGKLWQKDSTGNFASRVESSVSEACCGTLSVQQLRSLRPQRALVCEPTNLQVVVSHKGIVRWRCVVHGRAAHSSQPELGENAIYGMTQVIRAIQRYDREVLTLRAKESICGRPTCCVTTMHAGLGSNTVPDRAVIDIDRRLLPEEHPADAYRELMDTIAAQVDSEIDVEHQPPWNESRGLAVGDNRPWADQVETVVRSCGHTCEQVGVPFGTDAWVFGALGIPTIVFGPGSIDQAHTDDEWLAIDQLDSATEVFRRLALGESL